MDKLALGLRVIELRKELKLSQEGLSAKSGVARGAIQQLEKGDANPTIETLEAIAKALGHSFSDLLPLEPFSPQSAAEMSALLKEFSRLPPVRRAFVLALIYRDESFLDVLPEEIHHDCQSLMKAL